MEDLQNKIALSPLVRQVFVVSGAAVNILGHGCMHGYPAVLFNQLGGRKTVNDSGEDYDSGNQADSNVDIVISDVDASWIASVLGMMGFFGMIICPIMMNRFGRQKTHLFSTIPGILGWIAIFVATDIPTLIVARLLQGFAIGIRTPLAAILVAEYTSPEYRGVFLGTFAISLGLGILITHFIGAFMTWRMTALASSVFSIIALVIIGFSPESPSWLAAKGKFDKCSEAFFWLRGSSDEQKKQLHILIASQKMEKSESYDLKSVLAVFRKREFIKPAVIAICMLIMFEFGGAHIIPAYANRIVAEILGKPKGDTVHWQVTTVDSLRMVSALVAIVLLKHYNRRTILFVSGILTILSFSMISCYIYLRKNGINSPVLDEFLPITMIIFYVLSFCLGLVPLTWVICGEVFPLAHRSLGSTFSSLLLPFAFTTSLKTAPPLFASVGIEGAYLVYAAILALCLLIIHPLLPETKGRTLEEIESSFRGENVLKDVEITSMIKS